MTLHWVSCALRTGNILAEFPDLGTQGLRRTIGQYETATASFPVADPIHRPPSNWLDATIPYKTMLVALDDDGSPAAGGIVVKRRRVGGKPVEVSLITPEGYATRRNVRDTLQYPQTDRIFIAANLINRYIVDGADGRPGVPARVDVQSFGIEVDGDYADAADKTIYSILQDLGCEWTVSLERQSSPERITQVWELSDRLGTAADPASGPAVTLDWPDGALVAAEVVEDYSESNGGNDVMTTSSGQGSVRPQSDHQRINQPERPTLEIRQSGGDNVTSKAALNAYALRVLGNKAEGSRGFALTLPIGHPQAASIGLGDDIGIDLSGPEFPDNPTGVLRVAGIQYDASTVSPIVVGSTDQS